MLILNSFLSILSCTSTSSNFILGSYAFKASSMAIWMSTAVAREKFSNNVVFCICFVKSSPNVLFLLSQNCYVCLEKVTKVLFLLSKKFPIGVIFAVKKVPQRCFIFFVKRSKACKQSLPRPDRARI